MTKRVGLNVPRPTYNHGGVPCSKGCRGGSHMTTYSLLKWGSHDSRTTSLRVVARLHVSGPHGLRTY
ncbi:hypothetical protein RSAG8_12020, partial [Rhizoctonia solani AG-8 WAC10335]